ncbi:MAG: homoserine kinase [Tissierellaceae bacterium]|nr:homoserine kinase [Tissierellaceae bacterium]
MVEVKIPATSANLGPGFDSLGLALDLYNTFTFEEKSNGVEIHGFEAQYDYENNLVYASMLKTFESIGYSPKGISINADVKIPISRGLGSSASCILGGVLGANALAGNPLSNEEILKLATDIEGHPDNIAPALFGGLVTSIMDEGEVYYNQMDIHNGLKFVAIVPDFTLSTKESREVLPSRINYKDGVFNTGRVALLLSALSNGKFDLLKHGFKDKLHQPYRGKLIQGFDIITSKCDELGALGVYLSGAGPTIMAIVNEDNNSFSKEIKLYLDFLNYNWGVMELKLNLSGSIVNN